MRYAIRELGLGGILDQAIQLTKNNFGKFFGITAVLLIPYYIIQGLVEISTAVPMPAVPTAEDVARQFQHLGVSMPLLLVGLYFVIPITNAALIYSIAGEYLEKPAGVGESFKRAFQKILGLIGTWILVGLAIFGGMFLCIVPGIIAAFWFSLATQVVVVEGIAGVGALKRSRELMKGNIGTFFVLMLLVVLISGGLGFAGALIPQKHVQVLVLALVESVTTIFASAAGVVFYFSCRCKHENFDLALLAQGVGVETVPNPEPEVPPA